MKKSTGRTKTRPAIARLDQVKNDCELDDLQVHHEELQTQNEQLVEAQQALELSRLRYHELFDLAPVGYSTLSSVGTIEEVNLALVRLLGRERHQLVRRSLRTFVAPDHRRRFLAHLADCGSDERMHCVDLDLLAGDGENVPVRLITQAIQPGSLWTVITDQREQVSMRAERTLAEKREAVAAATIDSKDRFLAILSHELRTPLTPILAAVTSLMDLAELPTSLRPLLDVVCRNVRVEARLIDDLLDLTSFEHQKLSLEVESVNVHDVARDVAAAPGEPGSGEHSVQLELNATMAYVAADRMRLRQVLSNLLSNARRYSPKGGNVVIRTSDVSTGFLEFSVEDNGIGIDRSLLVHMFEPFVQLTKRRPGLRGLGLGLAICRGIVVTHGGQIEAHSDGLGKGTRIVVRWPTASRVAATPPPVESPKETARPLRILLVEDDEDCGISLAFLLRQAGHSVEVASSCAQARVVCVPPPDLIISDLDLPDGNGYDLLVELRQGRPLPALALSGFGAAEDRRRSLAAGFEEHLIKPIERSALLAAVASSVQRSGVLV